MEPGDRVATLLHTGEALLRSLLAAWSCRAAIVVIAPPYGSQPGSLALARTEAILRKTAPRLVVSIPEAMKPFGSCLDESTGWMSEQEALAARSAGSGDPPGPQADDLALLQFTSGSTAHPRGVMVRHRQIVEQVKALERRVGPGHRVVSWLPVHHDMGLVGGLCYPLYHGLPLHLLPTERFAEDPSQWLKAITRFQGSTSPGPNFAFELLARRVPEPRLKGIDLASWRYANIGAEPIFPGTLEAFEERFRAYGLSPTTLHPSYGLAEATLGVSLSSVEVPWSRQRLDREALRREGRAVASQDPQALEVVSNGPPLEGIEVRCLGPEGEVLEEDREGLLQIRGAYVSEGYWGEQVSGDPWRDTGDLGFLSQGEVFVTGRVKDLIIRGGANLHPQDLERAAWAVPGVRQGCVAAFSRLHSEKAREETVLLVETRLKEAQARERLAREVGVQVAATAGVQVDEVLLTAPRSLPKTTSGKLQRGLTRDLVESGLLPAQRSADPLSKADQWKLWWRLKWSGAMTRLSAPTRTPQKGHEDGHGS